MAASQKTLESLGSAVGELSKNLARQLEALSFAELTSEVDGPTALPPVPELQMTRMQLLETLAKLNHLVTGPNDYWLQSGFFMHHDALTLDVLNQFNFWDAVPVDGSASYAEIAKTTNLPEQTVRRFLRMAFTNFLFAPEGPNSDRVVHTGVSAVMARRPIQRSLLAHQLEDIRPAATVGVEALKKWSVGQQEPPQDTDKTAFVLASDNGRVRNTPLWEFFNNDEAPGRPKGYRAKRFAEAMQTVGDTVSIGTDIILEAFDWESLGKATVVDLGGSAGHISELLANKHPKLDLVVQDLASAESAFHANIGPKAVSSRIRFEAHDFLTKQTFPADVFLIKSVFHDWPDKYVVQIIQNLLPVMKPGDHVLIFDIIVPPEYTEDGNPTIPLTARKTIAAVDLQMLVAFNSRERMVEDWAAVVGQSHSKLALKAVHVIPGVPLGILDFVYEG